MAAKEVAKKKQKIQRVIRLRMHYLLRAPFLDRNIPLMPVEEAKMKKERH